MGTPLIRVRMRQAVDDFVQVVDLARGEVYALKATVAEQFIANGMADPVEAEEETLEVAALRSGRRRG